MRKPKFKLSQYQHVAEKRKGPSSLPRKNLGPRWSGATLGCDLQHTIDWYRLSAALIRAKSLFNRAVPHCLRARYRSIQITASDQRENRATPAMLPPVGRLFDNPAIAEAAVHLAPSQRESRFSTRSTPSGFSKPKGCPPPACCWRVLFMDRIFITLCDGWLRASHLPTQIPPATASDSGA